MFRFKKKGTPSPKHNYEESEGETTQQKPASIIQPSSSTASLDQGYTTGDSSTRLPDLAHSKHRPSLTSNSSDESSLSFYTAKSKVSSSSLHEGEVGNEEFISRMNALEKRVDEVYQKFENIERQLQQLNSALRSEASLPLPVVPEACEEDENGAEPPLSRSQPLECSGDVASSGSPRNRLYTDSEPLKVKGYRNIMRWKSGFKKRSQSLQQLLSNKSCDQQVTVWLSERVPSWKFLARRLGLPESDTSRIECDFPKDTREQCYQMFLKWKSADPHNYTYPVLGEALKRESQELYNDYVKEVHRIENKIPPHIHENK